MAERDIPSGPPTTIPREPPPGSNLILVDLENDYERNVLVEQRKVCGWGVDKIPFWRAHQFPGDRAMFWITLPKDIDIVSLTEQPGLVTLTRDDKTVWLVGHVSLDKIDAPSSEGAAPDESLAKADGSLLTISSLFVMPQVQKLRMGAFAMDQCEMLAQQSPYGSPNCIAITVNTMSSRYFAGGPEGPDGIDRWKLLGWPQPKMDNALWYKRRGYRTYKDQIRYFTDVPSLAKNNFDSSSLSDEGQLAWYATYLRKELRKNTI
ncbi:hypothetical protein MBLNU457_2216t1 [Dothideomycetes sp. NU457]